MIVSSIIGPGHAIKDKEKVPVSLRQIPITNGGIPPTMPSGAAMPTGSVVSNIPSPK
jgi:hypothetical protein